MCVCVCVCVYVCVCMCVSSPGPMKLQNAYHTLYCILCYFQIYKPCFLI